jgi:hypothetical protein
MPNREFAPVSVQHQRQDRLAILFDPVLEQPADSPRRGCIFAETKISIRFSLLSIDTRLSSGTLTSEKC